MFCKFLAVAVTTDFFLMWNEDLDAVCQNLTCYQPIALSLIVQWSLSKTGDRSTSTMIPHVPCWMIWLLCKAADPNKLPVQENGVCSDFNQTAQQFQIAICQSLELIGIDRWHDSELIASSWNQSLQPNQLQMQCCNWKPCRDLYWLGKLQFSIQRFFSNLHWFCNWK